MRVEHSIQVSLRPEEVFAFVANFENVPRWQKNVSSATKLTDGQVRAGTKFVEQIRMVGRTFESTCEITRLEASRRVDFVLTSRGPMACRGSFTFAPTQAGTRVSLSGEFWLKGLWKLMQPMAGRQVRRETYEELQALKAIVEGTGTGESKATQGTMRDGAAAG